MTESKVLQLLISFFLWIKLTGISEDSAFVGGAILLGDVKITDASIGLSIDSSYEVSNGKDAGICSSDVRVCIGGSSTDITFWIVVVGVFIVSETFSWIESNKDDGVGSRIDRS